MDFATVAEGATVAAERFNEGETRLPRARICMAGGVRTMAPQ
jgi:hypothetical protein